MPQKARGTSEPLRNSGRFVRGPDAGLARLTGLPLMCLFAKGAATGSLAIVDHVEGPSIANDVRCTPASVV